MFITEKDLNKKVVKEILKSAESLRDDLKIGICRLLDQYDCNNKFHKWEIGIVNEQGETNFDGIIRSFKTIDEALNHLSSTAIIVKNQYDHFEIFIDGWVLDPEMNETPEPVFEFDIIEVK